jgi:hypothetical protein
MKKLIVVLIPFIFASSSWATIYKWVDEKGVVNFADDYSKVPPIYRGSVGEISTPRKERTAVSEAPAEKTGVNVQSTGTATQVPPVSQQLVPEGDFALKLVTALKLGTPETEVQAEDILTSVGIAPENGWIADYPMTPIIIGQVQNAVVAAAALNKLPIGKDQALQAFQAVTAGFGLSIAAAPDQYAETETPPPASSEYVPPPEIENYYYEEGPPIVTYYPPPWDYYYLYAWVPYPFWCSGFRFRGFFILNDFHHFHHDHHFHHGHHLISNHFIDPKTHASLRVDPTTRTTGTAVTHTTERAHFHRFASLEARRGTASISNRSFATTRSAAFIGMGGRRFGGAVPHTPHITTGSRAFGQLGNTGRQYRNFQEPGTGVGASFGRPHSRSFSSPPSRSFSTPYMGGGSSFSGLHGGGGGIGSRGFLGSGNRR